MGSHLQALMILDYTIPLLGKMLDQMLAVILSVLNRAKLIDELKEKVCDVWKTLINTCGWNSKTLQSRLPQIVITLLQLGAKFPDKVKPSLQLLLVDWRERLKSNYIKIPELTCKSEELQVFTDYLNQQRIAHCRNLPEMLQLSIDGIKSEDDDLQLEHLNTLKSSIQQHFEIVVQTLSGLTPKDLETEGKRKIGELIRLLLAKSTHTNKAVRHAAMSCLGQLSAIEPSRIPSMERLSQHAEESDDDLAIHVLNEYVVRMLMGSSKRTRLHNEFQIVQLVIQELLKFLEIDQIRESITSPAKIFRQASTQYAMSQAPPPARAENVAGSKRGRENWAKVQQKNIVAPWLFTTLKPPEMVHESKASVFKPGISFDYWCRTLSLEVAVRCKGSRGELLKKLLKLLKRDLHLALFVLSPAVRHLVCWGDESDVEFVHNEFTTVLKHANDSVQLDDGELVDRMGAGWLKLRSSKDSPPSPDELKGMEITLSAGESRNSRNICNATVQGAGGDRQVLVQVLPPFPDTVFLESDGKSDILYSITKGESSHEDKVQGSTQVVFKILDDLTGLQEYYSREAVLRGRHCPEEVLNKKQALNRFLKKIQPKVLADASCQCGAYDRALLYLEESIRQRWHAKNRATGDRAQLCPPLAKILLSEQTSEAEREACLTTLHRIYAGLEDDDGLVGISKLRKEISLDEKIKTYELGGDWNQALACYEQALKQSPCATRYIDYLTCLRNLGHLQAMLTQSQGEIRNYPYHAHEFRASALQAAWRLGRWDLVEEHMSAAVANGDFTQKNGISKMPFESRLATVLLSMHDGDQQAAHKKLEPLRQCVIQPLAAASIESYERAYPHMIRLHMINEIERSFRVVFNASPHDKEREIALLRKEWDMRLELTQPSMGEREPLLALRRSIFAILGSRSSVADGWLEFAKEARRAGHASTATSAILQAESFGAPMAFLERSKLQWSNEHERHQALNSLRSCINSQLQQLAANTGPGAPAVLKSVMLYWKWVHESGLQQTSEVIDGFQGDLSKFNNARTINVERTHFLLGQLYESLVFPHRHARVDERRDASGASASQSTDLSYLAQVLEHYGASLKYGHKHIFQSLPRLLTLWFECTGDRYASISRSLLPYNRSLLTLTHTSPQRGHGEQEENVPGD